MVRDIGECVRFRKKKTISKNLTIEDVGIEHELGLQLQGTKYANHTICACILVSSTLFHSLSSYLFCFLCMDGSLILLVTC